MTDTGRAFIVGERAQWWRNFLAKVLEAEVMVEWHVDMCKWTCSCEQLVARGDLHSVECQDDGIFTLMISQMSR